MNVAPNHVGEGNQPKGPDQLFPFLEDAGYGSYDPSWSCTNPPEPSPASRAFLSRLSDSTRPSVLKETPGGSSLPVSYDPSWSCTQPPEPSLASKEFLCGLSDNALSVALEEASLPQNLTTSGSLASAPSSSVYRTSETFREGLSGVHLGAEAISTASLHRTVEHSREKPPIPHLITMSSGSSLRTSEDSRCESSGSHIQGAAFSSGSSFGTSETSKVESPNHPKAASMPTGAFSFQAAGPGQPSREGSSGRHVRAEEEGAGDRGKSGSVVKTEGCTCTVCGDKANGNFFGATICLPCKSFYIRCTKDGEPTILKQCHGTCDVSKQLRNRCQFCRFQRCLAIGMSRKEKPEVVTAKEGEQLCRVCGDLANGVHFGVFTCEGCKKFFRRGLKESDSYVCRSSKECALNPRNRNHCRYCRYQKCLAAGMSREAIKMGRPRKSFNSPAAFDDRALVSSTPSASTKPAPSLTESTPRSSQDYQDISQNQNGFKAFSLQSVRGHNEEASSTAPQPAKTSSSGLSSQWLGFGSDAEKKPMSASTSSESSNVDMSDDGMNRFRNANKPSYRTAVFSGTQYDTQSRDSQNGKTDDTRNVDRGYPMTETSDMPAVSSRDNDLSLSTHPVEFNVPSSNHFPTSNILEFGALPNDNVACACFKEKGGRIERIRSNLECPNLKFARYSGLQRDLFVTAPHSSQMPDDSVRAIKVPRRDENTPLDFNTTPTIHQYQSEQKLLYDTNRVAQETKGFSHHLPKGSLNNDSLRMFDEFSNTHPQQPYVGYPQFQPQLADRELSLRQFIPSQSVQLQAGTSQSLTCDPRDQSTHSWQQSSSRSFDSLGQHGLQTKSQPSFYVTNHQSESEPHSHPTSSQHGPAPTSNDIIYTGQGLVEPQPHLMSNHHSSSYLPDDIKSTRQLQAAFQPPPISSQHSTVQPPQDISSVRQQQTDVELQPHPISNHHPPTQDTNYTRQQQSELQSHSASSQHPLAQPLKDLNTTGHQSNLQSHSAPSHHVLTQPPQDINYTGRQPEPQSHPASSQDPQAQSAQNAVAPSPFKLANNPAGFDPYMNHGDMHKVNEVFVSLNTLMEACESSPTSHPWNSQIHNEGVNAEFKMLEDLMQSDYDFSPLQMVNYWRGLVARTGPLTVGDSMSQRHRGILDHMLKVYTELVEASDNSKYESGEMGGRSQWPERDAKLRTCWKAVQSRIIRGTQLCLKCAFQVPGMEKIHPNDKNLLVRRDVVFSMGLLNASTVFFDADTQEFKHFFNWDMSHDHPMAMLRQRLLSIGRRLFAQQMDLNELSLIFALNIVCLEKSDFSDEATLERVMHDLLMTLATYISGVRKMNPVPRLKSLFLLMPRMRLMGVWHGILMKNMKFDNSLTNINFNNIQLNEN